MAKSRFSQSQKSLWIIPLTALALLGVATLSAQTISLSENPEEAPLPPAVRVDLTVLQVILSPDHPMGMSLGTEEIVSAIQGEGLEALGDALSEFGQVSLLYRGEAAGLIGESLGIDLGGEVPYLTTYRGEGGSVTQTQQSIRDGLSASFSLLPVSEEMARVAYRVDLNWARPVERESVSMVERSTVDWQGETSVDLPEDCVVGRAVRLLDERLTELLFILQVSE